MSDVFGSVDPVRLFVIFSIALAALVLMISTLFAVCLLILAPPLAVLKREAATEFQDPDPFLAPGSHNGLRVGPPTARARSGSRTSGSGTPQ